LEHTIFTTTIELIAAQDTGHHLDRKAMNVMLGQMREMRSNKRRCDASKIGESLLVAVARALEQVEQRRLLVDRVHQLGQTLESSMLVGQARHLFDVRADTLAHAVLCRV
jgi:hypothetical protein